MAHHFRMPDGAQMYMPRVRRPAPSVIFAACFSEASCRSAQP
eukprot:CAMPEP_0197934758 /NCGR_PEP_ID=MMETSP1439-20131203/112315_1 /TAXON_ID=66791 /ORGANISM="Gonyaulax spinifera, Strain CCMP409" /LENGTH=41 /DNA_ID= /DNA_START= /DNA_END= /DNA_ORIENTATION=